jgi:hypothetical protein
MDFVQTPPEVLFEEDNNKKKNNNIMNDKTRTKKTGTKRGLLKGENKSSFY